ncbi:hypothetical protein ACIPRD_11145 [Streptomyces sp. NPDC090108]|uniref:hypothetical protein n=1 Tax=Streptomyces sp. NPDC090108 TaxID=3365947 RepID=UPI0037F8F61B
MIVRRAVGAAVSVTVAAAALLAVAGAASAEGRAGGPHGAPARVAGGHDGHAAHASRAGLGSADDPRAAWVLDQVQWARAHGLPLQDR